MLRNLTKNVQRILGQKGLPVSCYCPLLKKCQQFTCKNRITIVSGFISVSMFLLILYMLISPPPGLPIPEFANKLSVTTGPGQGQVLAPLATYLQPLKTRELFKPSIPIPTEKKIGKTTAQQLAERLQFLGTSGDGQNLSALVFVPERGPGLFQTGDRVAEFILKDIKTDSLILELENEEIVLKR